MKIHNVEQGSEQWRTLRAGVVTASEFDSLVTPEWKIRTGEGVKSYLYQKLCERFIGTAALSDFSNFAVDQGALMEHEAVPLYEFEQNVEVQKVGFITTDDGLVGCSPDGLIGDKGGLEVKCPQPKTHLRYLDEGVVPKEYIAQIYLSLFVTGRDWWDFLSYSRQFPKLLVRVQRDEAIQEIIASALKPFLAKLGEAHARISKLKQSQFNLGSRD